MPNDETPIAVLLNHANDFYANLLGYKPEATGLKRLPEPSWNSFMSSMGFDPKAFGVYLPRNQLAIIRENNPLSLFHEYFGHGLYCEQSLVGKRFVYLEQRLLEDEKRNFPNGQFTIAELKKFRDGNKTFQELSELRKQHMHQYETFAIWTEYLLSNEFNLENEFEKKYHLLGNVDREALEAAIGFNQRYGDLATFYANGLARNTSVSGVRKMLDGIFGRLSVEKSKLVLLTGSKKPFSDIDLFASSSEMQSKRNGWLDLVVFEEEDFERRVKLFEIQVAYPIMYGKLVAGDLGYLGKMREWLLEQPITSDAIIHNLEKADFHLKLSKSSSHAEQRRVSRSYFESYLKNALSLKEGKRSFEV